MGLKSVLDVNKILKEDTLIFNITQFVFIYIYAMV